jgi:hypothetical protein
MAVPGRRVPQPKQLNAGPFAANIGSFRLHLAAEAKAPRTIRNYTGAVHWFAAAHLLLETGKTRWEQVDRQDIERWMVYLLGRYSAAYASVQYRALQQFFKWWAEEVGHRWHRSSCAAFSWLCSLFLVRFVFLLRRCPSGAVVVAGRPCPAFA